MADKFLLTIGYGRSKRENFIRALICYNIKCLVDVRSIPKSNYNREYDQENLIKALKENGIDYIWLGDYIGGRSDDLSLFEGKTISYKKLVNTEKFIEGLEKLKNIIKDNNTCIMCSESEPMDCHRFLAISKKLSEEGYEIWHIRADGTYTKNVDLERELISKYFNDAGQIELFSNLEIKREESYRRQNMAKGYKKH